MGDVGDEHDGVPFLERVGPRSRADADTKEARVNDTSRREAALKSGAQWVSTDYLWPDPRFPGGYRARLAGGAATLCNPVRKPAGCGPVELAGR